MNKFIFCTRRVYILLVKTCIHVLSWLYVSLGCIHVPSLLYISLSANASSVISIQLALHCNWDITDVTTSNSVTQLTDIALYYNQDIMSFTHIWLHLGWGY